MLILDMLDSFHILGGDGAQYVKRDGQMKGISS